MADELDALLEHVSDTGLRSELRDHIERLRRHRTFGLVYESHLPERVRLPDHPIRRGAKVVRRTARVTEAPQEVLRIEGNLIVLGSDDNTTQEVPRDDLVVVAEFGDPIYPGLKRLGRIERGDDKPHHVVIKGENYHALQALRFTHAGKIDCIYIDPPYNTGARDWKYDNDYVDDNDEYRHSKWLAFMERRLHLAKDLLNPDNSALIVTIDEKEVHRLGLLLEQIYPDADIQMVTSVINAKGVNRVGKFARVEEHIFYLTFGSMSINKWTNSMLSSTSSLGSGDNDSNYSSKKAIEWLGLRRREPSSVRSSRPNQFYPIFVDAQTGYLQSIGDPLNDKVDRESVNVPLGTVALWPLKPDGTEMLWGLTPNSLRDNWEQGYVRARADRCFGGVSFVGVFGEFDDEDDGDGQGELAEACFGVAVGVAA